MVLVASETGHVYTYATDRLKPMIMSDRGRALIHTCLTSADALAPAAESAASSGPSAASRPLFVLPPEHNALVLPSGFASGPPADAVSTSASASASASVSEYSEADADECEPQPLSLAATATDSPP